MPVSVKSWACVFRCGKVGTQKKRIVKHEKECYNNPLVRACKTCRHNEELENSPDIGLFGGWDCAVDMLAETGPESKARANCIAWEPKEQGR